MEQTYNQNLTDGKKYANYKSMLKPSTKKLLSVPKNDFYYGDEYVDWSGYSIGGSQSVRVSKQAIPIKVKDQVEGIMVWEEDIDQKFAHRIIPQSFETH